MDMKRFGRMVYRLRKAKGVTSDDVSVGCGCNPVFIRKIESGTRFPSLPMFVMLCNTLGVSPQVMLAEELYLPPEALLPYDELANAARALTPYQIGAAAHIVRLITLLDRETLAHITSAIESMSSLDPDQLAVLAKMIEGMTKK